MEYLCYKIIPRSSFGTEPSSDSFFGQICYTLNLMGERLDDVYASYVTEPFIVVSSFFPMGYGLVPKIPKIVSNNIDIYSLSNRKKAKKLCYIKINDIVHSKSITNVSGSIWKTNVNTNIHVNIDRILGTTTEETATPYSLIDYDYKSIDSENPFYFHVYVYVKDEWQEKVYKAMEYIGKYGYGKRASIGKGLYDIEEDFDYNINMNNITETNAVYTLSNCALYNINYGKVYYEPIVKFAKHGYNTYNIYNKNPYVLAQQGALIYDINDKNIFKKIFIGRAVESISTIPTMTQGYSLYLPVKYSGENNG